MTALCGREPAAVILSVFAKDLMGSMIGLI